jgi:hypothetical protein
LAPAPREKDLRRRFKAAYPDGGFEATASWAREGMEAAEGLRECLAGPLPSPARIAALRSRLEEIPSGLAATATGLFGDYCRMALMDLDPAGSSGVLGQLARRFREIQDVAEALAAPPGSGHSP